MWKAILSDRAVVSGLLVKLIQGIASPVSAVLTLHYFNPEMQGYYYTFSSLLALQLFLELGLSTIITTFAAHEWSLLSFDREGRPVGEAGALARLSALAKKTLRWYSIAAGFLAVALICAGTWFFGLHSQSESVEWQNPWIALSLLSAINFLLIPGWALLQGCGQIAVVNSLRIVEVICRSAVLWGAIVAGAALWSTVAAAMASIIVAIAFFLFRYRAFFSTLLETKLASTFDWKSEVAPVQWRIAASWICGYFIFYLFTPVTFYFLGPVEAGQMGMTWALVSSLAGLATTWFQVRSPSFGGLVAQREFGKLDVLAIRTAATSILVCVVLSGIAIAGLLILNIYRPGIAGRFLPLSAVTIFLIAESLHQIPIAQATYLRAFKKEPFLSVSVSTAIIVGAGMLVFIPMLGVIGTSVSYLAGVVGALIGGSYLFFRKRREWTFPRPIVEGA